MAWLAGIQRKSHPSPSKRIQKRAKRFWGLVEANPRCLEARAILEALKGPELPPDEYADPRQEYRPDLMNWAADTVLDVRKHLQEWGDELKYLAYQNNDGDEAWLV